MGQKQLPALEWIIPMFHKKSLKLMSWLVVAVWTISACTPSSSQVTSLEQSEGQYEDSFKISELRPISLGPGQKLQVIATTNIVADMVKHVAGDVIDLTQLIPPGADPHTYTISPRDVVAMTKAHVVFANGANLESEFLPDLMQQTDAPVIYVSQGIELRELGENEAHDHKTDPHTWTTPINAIVFVHNIRDALSALNPDNAEVYELNAENYEAELIALDEWIKAQIATIPVESRKLVTDHETFSYYAERYGLEQIGAVIPGFSSASEPSARQLAALEDAIRQYHVPALFVGTTVTPSLAQQVAADTGIKVVTLYTGSLGLPGSDVQTYLDYMRYNTTAIVEGLR
jgi:manganese/iron transport system substrate-binding protein